MVGIITKSNSSKNTLYADTIKRQPDLKIELQIVTQLPYGSKGFKSRGEKILKELENIN